MHKRTKSIISSILCATLLLTNVTITGGAELSPARYANISESYDSLSMNGVSGNDISDASISDNTVSEASISENAVSENSVSRNSVSENTVSKASSTVAEELQLSDSELAPNYASVKIKDASSLPKFTTCKIKNGHTVLFKTKIKKEVASSDDYYYLARLNPMTDKIEAIIKSEKKSNLFTYHAKLSDDTNNSLLFGKYALFVKTGNKYKAVTQSTFISNPEAAADYTAAFPKSSTKKGLQGCLTKGDLGVNHSLINLRVSDVIAEGTNGVPYIYNGKTYYFKKNPMVAAIQSCNQSGITLSVVFLLDYRADIAYLIPKKARKAGVANYYAWDVKSKQSRETFEAMFSYLAELYSNQNCHVDNWILGNEFNSAKTWHYAGSMKRDAQIEYYAQAFRIMYYAVKSHYKNARCYISLDANWRDNGSSLGAKDIMLDFNKALKAQNPKIRWNLAYHAYPIPLTQADFWNNHLPTMNAETTHYVTPKNLSILTSFVKKNFGSSCRIILSEQGFTSTSGEDAQAAAVAYAYYVAQFDSMVDSFIMRAEYDHPVEVAAGLKLGLSTVNGYRKPAYYVFKYMDTPSYKTYTADALKTLKVSNWKHLIKSFNEKKLKNKSVI